MNILTVNLLFSTLVFWIAARLYLLPRLAELEPRTVLLPILLPRAALCRPSVPRPGAVFPGVPPQIAYPRRSAICWRVQRWWRSAVRNAFALRQAAGLDLQHRKAPT